MFSSVYAHLIWEKLYTVRVPDLVTQDDEYLKIFGVRVTGNKQVDAMVQSDYITCMHPVIKLVEFYDSGVPILVPKREDMIQMHKDIQSYLQEWKNELTYSLNMGGKLPKELLDSLDKFSKHIYEKASAIEIMDNKIKSLKIGLVPRISTQQQMAEPVKPDYEGIGQLIRQRTKLERY